MTHKGKPQPGGVMYTDDTLPPPIKCPPTVCVIPPSHLQGTHTMLSWIRGTKIYGALGGGPGA